MNTVYIVRDVEGSGRDEGAIVSVNETARGARKAAVEYLQGHYTKTDFEVFRETDCPDLTLEEYIEELEVNDAFDELYYIEVVPYTVGS